MKFNPYSVEHAPQALPIWHTILEDLGNPPPARIARVLGLGRRTIYRYNHTGRAPRHVCLALFWLTRWGRSQVYCQAVHDCQVAVSYANCLEADLAQVRDQLAHVLKLNQAGAANDAIEGFFPFIRQIHRESASPTPQAVPTTDTSKAPSTGQEQAAQDALGRGLQT
jgi:hypothetical protein